MAGTITKSRRTTLPNDQLHDLTIQFNNLITAFDAVLAKLDLDGGVTDTNYASLHGTTASKIGDQAGTAITA
jgi:hypothetical protein